MAAEELAEKDESPAGIFRKRVDLMDKNKLRIFILKNASRADKIIQLGMVPITRQKDRRSTLAKNG